MGKSQLAFALGGKRSWFYWPISSRAYDSQLLYDNFVSISGAFDTVTGRDGPTSRVETDILNSTSDFYYTASLWTYGFIRVLLEHCSKHQNQDGQMLCFPEEALYVHKCDRTTVVSLREKVKSEGKLLPFVVLDEMTPNSGIKNEEGMKLAAFQRNVFRVCGLVVIVMGTDAKIANLVEQAGSSSKAPHLWMTVISRFPPYQAIPFADEEKQNVWYYLHDRYPVLNNIVVNSRGRFARRCIDGAVQCTMTYSTHDIQLWDLLDAAFDYVSYETQYAKRFMRTSEGRHAQLVAISYTNADTSGTSPPPRKKLRLDYDAGTCFMHLHFANLMDAQITDVALEQGLLRSYNVEWKPWCCFPAIEKDLLLYLAILGGKNHSGYDDRSCGTARSTLCIFSDFLAGPGFSWGENTHAVCNDYKTFENMVAHMIFCASRRNGVQGIPFDDFFVGLLSECQDETQVGTMSIGDASEAIFAFNLLDEYADLAYLRRTKIPFLAPPNAKWPQCILDTNGHGCNFGHLIRTRNAERCDVCVCNMEDLSTPLFLCECKYHCENVGFDTMIKIIDELESVWKEKWAAVLVFCLKLAAFEKEWDRKTVGCVKVDCRSCHVEWVFQPVEENRKKLVIVMETGSLA